MHISPRSISRRLLVAGGFALAGLVLALPGARAQSDTAISRASRLATLSGEVEVLVEDHADRGHRLRHVLHTSRGEVELRFRGRAPALVTGQKLEVTGEHDASIGVMELDGNGSSQTQSTSSTVSNASGEQKVAVILVNFQDDATQPITRSAAQQLVNGDIDAFYRENSSGLTWLNGQAFGWYTIPVSRTNCHRGLIADEADLAAARAGVNLAPFNRKIYVFPKTSACSWSGLATVGGTTSQAWINGVFDLRVVAHELGHNFGLLHSDGLDCDRTSLGDVCNVLSYADHADLMGNTVAHFNPFQKEILGWLNGPGTPQLTTVSTSGRYLVEAYAAPGLGSKALKIRAGTDPYSGAPRWYYVDYRQRIGFDQGITTAGNITNGVMVRRAAEGVPDSSVALDMTPQSDLRLPVWDLRDGALAVGARFDDAANGVSITLAWMDGQVAAVDVVVPSGPASCVRAAPTLTLIGGANEVAAGQGTTYTVSLKNNDSAACAASTFSLSRQIPAGWSGQLGATSLGASAGGTTTTTLAVTTATTTAAGAYSVTTTASRSTGAGAQATRQLSVQAAALTAKVQSLSIATAVKGKSTRATATAVIVDQYGKAVSGASVTGCFSGAVSDCGAAATDSAGRVSFSSSWYKGGSVTFCVTGVSGHGFDPSGSCKSN